MNINSPFEIKPETIRPNSTSIQQLSDDASDNVNNGRWTNEDHIRFIEGIYII